MRREERPINFPGADATGTPTNVADFNGGSVGLDGAWTGTVAIEGLLSSSMGTWTTIAGAVAGAGVYAVTSPFCQIRINGTAMSGPNGAKAIFVGFNTRTR